MQMNMWRQYNTVDNHKDTYILIRSINGVESLENMETTEDQGKC